MISSIVHAFFTWQLHIALLKSNHIIGSIFHVFFMWQLHVIVVLILSADFRSQHGKEISADSRQYIMPLQRFKAYRRSIRLLFGRSNSCPPVIQSPVVELRSIRHIEVCWQGNTFDRGLQVLTNFLKKAFNSKTTKSKLVKSDW